MRSNIIKALACLVLLGFMLTSLQLFPNESNASGQNQLERFSSYEELEAFVKASTQVYSYGIEGMPFTFFGQDTNKVNSTPAPDYSVTNIQVEGVDEADIIKTDGEYIYLVSGKRVVIVKAYPPEEARFLSEIWLEGSLKGLFINESKLVVFEQQTTGPDRTSETSVKVYDISNRENPLLDREVSLDGQYFGSRMIGDYTYVVVNAPVYDSDNKVILPEILSGDKVREIRASDIYYSDVSDHACAFTTIIAVNTQRDDLEPAYETILLGAASQMYVSMNNIYITFPEMGWMAGGAEKTTIHRINIENGKIEYKDSGEVPGRLLNQFSMDEYQGYFRVATTTGSLAGSLEEATSQNNLYILDMNLNIIGKLEDLAPGESIYSARFMDDRCYLVTFRKVDPLFVIDLKNPYDPKVLGELKITGYSDYLHPYDENHIIGIGKETVAAQWGDFAWYQGVKISLFDVSDVSKPKEIDKFEIGDRGTDSPILRDHKAFLFDESKNLLVIPVLVAEIDEEKYPYASPQTYGHYVWQGAYIFDISLDEGLGLKGRITHHESGADLGQDSYYFSSNYSVERSLYIGNVLYTISGEKIKLNSLEDLSVLNEIALS